MFTTDSLFSLEFVIEKVKINPGTVCRFPAVALRLLDFPTIPVHLLDVHQRTILREKINADPYYKIPNQITEYQDREGWFVFSAGKSCLYRMSPDGLREQLTRVPLYVIVADDFTPTPCLVGSAVLSLAAVMQEVYDSLLSDGVSLPTSSGIRSSVGIYNLMGQHVGQVIVGCRLVSLGMTLLTHLPESAITSVAENRLQPTVAEKETIQVELGNKQLKGILTDMKNEQVHKEFPLVLVEKSTNTDGAANSNNAAISKEAERKKRIKDLRTHLRQSRDEFEGIGPDIFCPPPLYYERDAVAQPVEEYKSVADSLDSVSDEFSYHSSNPSQQYIAEKQDKENTEKKIRDPKSSQPIPSQQLNRPLQYNPAAFPLLNALMAEIMRIGETPFAESLDQTHKQTPSKRTDQLRESPARNLLSPNNSRAHSSSPIAQSSPARCRSPSSPMRPGSSLEGSRPGSRQLRRSGERSPTRPLMYGYTNTQKLRLLKTNPDYLRKIELMEEKQGKKGPFYQLGSSNQDDLRGSSLKEKLKLKLPKGRSKGAFHSFRSYTSHNLDVSTEMGRLASELVQVKRELDQHKLKHEIAMNSQLGVTKPAVVDLGITRTLTPKSRGVLNPKPSSTTPRRSMSARLSGDGDLSTLQEYPSQSYQSLQSSTGLSSKKSLEIHIPTPLPPEDSSERSSRDSRSRPSAPTPYSEADDTFHTATTPPSSPLSVGLQRMDSIRSASPDKSRSALADDYGSSSFESLSQSEAVH